MITFRKCLWLLACAVSCAPISAWALQDTDADGFPDVFEAELGTNPNDASSTPTGQPAVVKPLDAFVFVKMREEPAADLLTFRDTRERSQPFSAAGKKLVVYIGGFLKTFTFTGEGTLNDGNGTSASCTTLVQPPNLPPLNETGVQIYLESNTNLSPFLADEGIDGAALGQKVVKVEMAYFFDGVLYSAEQYRGLYEPPFTPPEGSTVETGVLGMASFVQPSVANQILEPLKLNGGFFPFNPTVDESVEFFISKSVLDILQPHRETLAISADFGDGTGLQPFAFSERITHKFVEPGIYDIQISYTYTMDNEIVSGGPLTYSIPVGLFQGRNPFSGLGVDVELTPADATQPAKGDFRVTSAESAGAKSALIEFEDANANVFTSTQTRTTRAATRAAPVEGLATTRTFDKPGLTVVTVSGKNTDGQVFTKARKTAGIAGGFTKGSGIPASSTYFANDLKVEKLTASLDFSGAAKVDQVTVQTSLFMQPATVFPAEGLPVYVGVGHVLEVTRIDAKGKLIGAKKGVNGRLKTFRARLPQNNAGGRATFSFTLAAQDLDALGFDSEGIAPGARRTDEAGLAELSRRLPVNLMLDTEPFENRAKVLLKFDKKEVKAKLTLAKSATKR